MQFHRSHLFVCPTHQLACRALHLSDELSGPGLQVCWPYGLHRATKFGGGNFLYRHIIGIRIGKKNIGVACLRPGLASRRCYLDPSSFVPNLSIRPQMSSQLLLLLARCMSPYWPRPSTPRNRAARPQRHERLFFFSHLLDRSK
jgi:hypothetical protein